MRPRSAAMRGPGKTQRDRALAEVRKIALVLPGLAEPARRLGDVLGEAQNGPPDGTADGSIDSALWHQLRDLKDGILRLLECRVEVRENALEVEEAVRGNDAGDEEV